MNSTYSDLRENTLNDIKQVIDFYRLEITDEQEVHDTIEGSLAEVIAEWVPYDYDQIEITSSSMGDDLIISVCYTKTTENIDDQFLVVHNERDMFDNTTNMFIEMFEQTKPTMDLSSFSWDYSYSGDETVRTMAALTNSEIFFNFDTLSNDPTILEQLRIEFDDDTQDDTDNDIVRSIPLF